MFSRFRLPTLNNLKNAVVPTRRKRKAARAAAAAEVEENFRQILPVSPEAPARENLLSEAGLGSVDPEFLVEERCYDDIELFRQHSGQCWSDASSIFMLYTAYIGPLFQLVFNKYSTKQLETEYDKWFRLNGKDALKDILDPIDFNYIYKDNTNNTRAQIDNLRQMSFFYLKCLKQRYDAMEEGKRFSPPRRNEQKTIKLTLCQETSGITTSELMYSPERRDPSYPHLPDWTNLTMRLFGAENDLPRHNSFFVNDERGVEVPRGYFNDRFARVVALYIKFMASMPEASTLNIPKVFISKGNPKGHIALTRDEKVKLYFISKLELIPLLVTNTFNILGFTLHVRNEVDPTQAHAINCIRCSNSVGYVYDDNAGVLQQIDWPLLFNHNTIRMYSNPKIFYLYFSGRHRGHSPTVDDIDAKVSTILLRYPPTERNLFNSIYRSLIRTFILKRVRFFVIYPENPTVCSLLNSISHAVEEFKLRFFLLNGREHGLGFEQVFKSFFESVKIGYFFEVRSADFGLVQSKSFYQIMEPLPNFNIERALADLDEIVIDTRIPAGLGGGGTRKKRRGKSRRAQRRRP